MQPRWYQTEAVDAAWAHLCGQPGSPVIVLPTGAGKSLCIAMLCQKAREHQGRVIILAHRKELLEQNAQKIKAMGLNVGIYSAGLKKRNTEADVVLGGIQSVYNKAYEFGQRHLVLIDEVHLVPSDGEGMYQTFLKSLREVCPKVRLVGLTATPFRTGDGKLCRPDALFQRICYSAPIRRLIDEGFLSNLTTTPADATVDTRGLHIRAGEFVSGEMAALFADDVKIDTACKEILTKTAGRKSLLVFCAGVFHAIGVSKRIEELTGEECGLVTGETMPLERASLLARFKAGTLRRLCNCDVLTTGFDAPGIDAIAVLRATASPGLFAQICGRGLRIAPEKTDCLVLDFGSNIRRHGPLDSPTYGEQKKGTRGEGDAPTKTCPNCEEEAALSATACECGFMFPARDLARHGEKADEEAILTAEVAPSRWIVEGMGFSRHRKKDGTPDNPDTLRIDYVCIPQDGEAITHACPKCNLDAEHVFIKMPENHAHYAMLKCQECKAWVKWVSSHGNLAKKTVSEWVCLDHSGFAKNKAQRWWRERCLEEADSVEEALALLGRGAVAIPTHLTTKPEGKFIKILSYEMDRIPPREEWREEEQSEAADWEEVPF